MEKVTVAASSGQNDLLYFADGNVNLGFTNLRVDGAFKHITADMVTGEGTPSLNSYIKDATEPTLNTAKLGGVVNVTVNFDQDVVLAEGKSVTLTALVGASEVTLTATGNGSSSKSLVFSSAALPVGLIDVDGIVIKANSLMVADGDLLGANGLAVKTANPEIALLNQRVDTVAPVNSFTSAVYDVVSGEITLIGTGVDGLLSGSEGGATDISDRLDWSKLSWDFDGDNNVDSIDFGFTRTDIESTYAVSNSQLVIRLTALKSEQLEGSINYMHNGSALFDKVDVQAGFSKDAAGNLSSTDAMSNGSIGFDLGADMGYLVNGVQVEGKFYYAWDRNGDGLHNASVVNGVSDTMNHNVLDALFNYDLEGTRNTTVANYDGDLGTTNTYRFSENAGINGVSLALPTYGSTVDGSGKANDTGYQSGTAATDSAYYQTTDNSNPTYDDLLAVWDQFNGTSMATNTSGAPDGWSPLTYWSATPTTTGHAYALLYAGGISNNPDTNNRYVALEVL